MKLFIDANVLLDYFLKRPPFAENARELFFMGFHQKAEMYISVLSVSHCFYFIEKQLGLKKAYAVLDILQQLFKIAAAEEQNLDDAARKQWPDFEDALQASIAETVGCTHLVTRDKTGFTKATLQIVKPTEALALLKKL